MTSNPGGSKKGFRKSLKGPDAFQKKAAESFGYFARNRGAVIGLGVGLVGLGLAIGGFQYVRSQKKDEIIMALSKVEEKANQERKVIADQRSEFEKKIKEKNEKITELTKSGDQDAEIAKLQAEIEELEKSVDALKPDESGSQKAYYAFYQEFPQSPEGLMAGVKHATYLVEQGKPKEAEVLLKDILKDVDELAILKNQVHIALISLLEDREAYQEAQSLNEALLKGSPDSLKPRLLLTKGRLFKEAGELDQAKEVFQGLLKDHAKTPEADAARSYLYLIN